MLRSKKGKGNKTSDIGITQMIEAHSQLLIMMFLGIRIEQKY